MTNVNHKLLMKTYAKYLKWNKSRSIYVLSVLKLLHVKCHCEVKNYVQCMEFVSY